MPACKSSARPSGPPPRRGDIRIGAELVAHGLDGFHLRSFVAFLALDADEHIRRRAELLQRDLAEIEAAKRVAQSGDIDGLRRLHLDQDAALEIDAEIKALDAEAPMMVTAPE
jgi:hypothetical protein